MRKFLAAAIQLDSTGDKDQNIKNAVGFVGEAAARGAKLVAMPEQMSYVGSESRANAEDIPGGRTFQIMAELAAKYNIWLHCGSIYETNGSDPRPYNSCMVISPKGELAAKYRKIHTFDVSIKDGPTVKESDRVCPGHEVVTVDTGEVGHLGLSICYDIRFGEIFRLMALKGAQILFTPADFVLNTGKDHWEPILRTRAIENGCYVIAPAQCGVKPKFQAYGKSLIVDPWGNVIAKASDKPCVITAEIDLDYLDTVRNQVFTLQNRRADVYSLTSL
jgi:predicted amidohydrolase